MPAIDPSQSRSSLHSGSRWRRSSAAVLAGSVLIVAMGNTAVDADELDDLFGPVTVDAVEFYAPTADAEPVPAARTAMLFETPASPPAGPGGGFDAAAGDRASARVFGDVSADGRDAATSPRPGGRPAAASPARSGPLGRSTDPPSDLGRIGWPRPRDAQRPTDSSDLFRGRLASLSDRLWFCRP